MNDLRQIRQALRLPAYEEALAGHLGMNVTDLRALELIEAEPGMSAGRLAEATGLTTGAVTGVLDRLERSGFVERRPDPGDRRGVTVHVMPARAGELTGAREAADRELVKALDRHGPGGRAAILEFLGMASEVAEDEAARLRAAARGGFVGDVYTAPLGDTTRGRLVFVTGAPRVALNFAPLGPRATARVIMETAASRLRFDGAAPAGELIRATFEGPTPDVRVSAGVVTVRYRRQAVSAFTGRQARISLAGGIPWAIEIEGGITDLTGTLVGLSVGGIEIGGGANHVSLDLPAPAGTVPVRLRGVASSVRIRRPAAAATAVTVDGGVAHLRLDAEKREQVGGRKRFASPGFAASPDRYEIEVLGGASEVKISAR